MHINDHTLLYSIIIIRLLSIPKKTLYVFYSNWISYAASQLWKHPHIISHEWIFILETPPSPPHSNVYRIISQLFITSEKSSTKLIISTVISKCSRNGYFLPNFYFNSMGHFGATLHKITKLEPQRCSHRKLNRRTVKHWMTTIGGWLGGWRERQPQHIHHEWKKQQTERWIRDPHHNTSSALSFNIFLYQHHSPDPLTKSHS